jgi:hypothetical protein
VTLTIIPTFVFEHLTKQYVVFVSVSVCLTNGSIPLSEMRANMDRGIPEY